MAMVSYFDQFPEWNGVKFHFRSKDGYCAVASLNKAMGGKRFDKWLRSKFAKEVVSEISQMTKIPVDWESQGGCPNSTTPLIDYDRSKGTGVFIHPYLVSAYALQDPKLYARVSIWMGNQIMLGTVNPHVLDWTRQEFERGIEFNRDDIKELYGE